MAEYFARGHLRFVNGEWRNDDGDIVEISRVRHGKWVLVDSDVEQFFMCNKCNEKEYWESDYCPNCGCRMDGGN